MTDFPYDADEPTLGTCTVLGCFRAARIMAVVTLEADPMTGARADAANIALEVALCVDPHASLLRMDGNRLKGVEVLWN